ncbi:hypothetical protein E2C01_021040 [Portunus trituberculatus]|uniref:Uncharacterized protein n=1 Tax=Portunus trituberculatus TaxID=210409 RepID=A0A5B7E508_PORTR|nr:hypothetical protein [Portunus trituberculatus]
MNHHHYYTTTTITITTTTITLTITTTEGGVVDKVLSVGSDRRPRVGSNPTIYRFVEWFKVTYMSP